ncbi:MAG: gliding motility-associated C-terminal domain-containing protein [Saprospiraceae bacterium]|nr:gliding motility-associated C-terminal domain-containing protein [Saprospiraceae bacterium]
MVRTLLVLLALVGLIYFPVSAADYYWVGGSGNWSDISHWVTTSGGTVQHNTIPTASDRVFFDERSFTGPNQVVTVNTPTVFCKDLVWTGATGRPVFTAPEHFVLQIHGSLILNPDMVFDFKGDVLFLASDPDNEINLAGHTLQRNATFAGVGGEWILLDGFKVDSLLRWESGMFFAAGQPITCELLRIRPSGLLQLELGTSYLTVTGVPYRLVPWAEWEPVAEIEWLPGLTLSASQATLDFSSPDVFFRVRNPFPEPVHLGTVVFSNPIGKSLLQKDPKDNFELHIQRLAMRNDSKLIGAMRFGTLQLGEGKNFTFDAGYTYVLEQLTAPGTCSTPIQLFGSEPGRAVVFRATAGTISGSYLSLRDIHAEGGATFTADNSADLGNNIGWAITPKSNTKLYWVGGSGNWNDPAHWAQSSGGPGGSCVPTAGDDVFFDANSFPSPGAVVLLNIDNPYCRSMDWTGVTGNPTLQGSFEKNLHIFGSLTLIPDMQLDFEGDVFFESNNPGNSIASSGKLFKKNAVFDGQGSWRLLDSLDVTRYIYFNQGNLNTNDQVMACQQFHATTSTPRSMQLGNSHIKLRTPDYNYLNWWLNADNLSFDAGTSTIEYFWYGDLRHLGTPQLNYHKVICNFGSSLNSDYPKLNHIIDTLEMWGGGFFSSSTKVGTWRIARGSEYVMDEGDTLFVDDLRAPGGCGRMIEFRSNQLYRQAYMAHKSPLTLDRIVVQDVHSVGQGILSATNSVNLGNSEGWVFSQNAGRDLYWVGGSGMWHETEHWSLTSGGPGGECAPTPVDNVFFDENSFSEPNQRVGLDVSLQYCKNMTWGNLGKPAVFWGHNLHVFGSITTSPDVKIDWWSFLALRSEENNNYIKIGAAGRIDVVEVIGGGSFLLQDSLDVRYFTQRNGVFHSNGYGVELDYFTGGQWYRENSPKLIMGGSPWQVKGDDQIWQASWSVYGPMEFQGDSSLVEFTSPRARIYSDHSLGFNNVLFSAQDGQSKIEAVNVSSGVFNRLEFRNNGIIIGPHTIDSLIFSAGKSYQLDAFQSQVVKDYFQMIGNNCLSIGLSSTQPGQQSTVIMNGGVVAADFVQMRDQLGQGTTRFFAGNNSTNIGNSNTNWVFESAEDYVDDGILGRDIVLCKASSVELDGRTYSPGETYRWSTGESSPTIGIDQPGTYWVELRYGDNCVLRDSIVLLEPEAFIADLPADTTLCEGDTLRLEPDIDLLGLTFLWQDSSTQSSFTVRQPGNYKVTLELTGCTASDSLSVAYTPTPAVNLGTDQLLCPDQTTTLNTTLPDATAYRWQDGSTNATFLASSPGNYVAEVFNGRCVGTDTVQIAYEAPLGLDLGGDMLICENTTVTLIPKVNGEDPVVYRWQNGSAANTFLAGTAGIFWVEATRNGCSERDSIAIGLKSLPRFELGQDTVLCEGEQALLGTNVPGATYLWQDGNTSNTIQISRAGTYWLQTEREGCVFRDTLSASYTVLPTNRLGADKTICQGQTLTLDASVDGATYAWQDGSSSPQLTTGTAGSYEVSILVGRCSIRDTVAVGVLPLPVFELGRDTQLCAPAALLLQVGTPADSYRWQDGSSQSAFLVGSSGLIRATAVKEGCSWTDSLRVEVFDPLVPNLGTDTTICDNTSLILRSDVSAQAYRWQDGSTGSSFEVTSPGLYTLSTFEGPCSVSNSINIAFRSCTVFKAFLPNAFSPNGDGTNDDFRPFLPPDVEVMDYMFRVFDRWGNLVFETNQTDAAWDGTFRGSALPQGVFVYFLHVKYRDDFVEDTAQLSGDVLLTR